MRSRDFLRRAGNPVERCLTHGKSVAGDGFAQGGMLMTVTASGVTELLAAVQAGDEAAVNRLLPVIYEKLRRLAKRHLAGQRPGHTLQTTDLVNEAYLKLVNVQQAGWKDRIHFFAVASRAMRSVLVDYARKRGYAKRGSNPVRVSLSEADQTSEQNSAEIIAVDDALSRLAELDPRKSQIVELRYFGGLSVEESAELIGLSPRTVKREWRWAKAWLYRALGEQRAQ
jgi:RNA polymerase sigma factor (TIGR02999 family)